MEKPRKTYPLQLFDKEIPLFFKFKSIVSLKGTDMRNTFVELMKEYVKNNK